MYSEKFLRQIGDYSKDSVDTAPRKEVLSLECNLEKAVAKKT